MRQVPCYLIIGNGCVAKHFAHYFTLLGLSFKQWSRQNSLSALAQYQSDATHILILINDHAIETFAKTYLSKSTATLIHFSGSLLSDHIIGAHPLMTFNDALYTLADYEEMTFVVDHDAPPAELLLPQLPNAIVTLDKSLKEKYHALCVLSGNFSCLLWQKIFSEFENTLKIPPQVAHAYLKRQTQNLLNDYRHALSGPLLRGDQTTIDKNLLALSDDHYQTIYQAFVNAYQAGLEKKQ